MKIDQHTDPMAYQPYMEITSSAIMEQVLAAVQLTTKLFIRRTT